MPTKQRQPTPAELLQLAVSELDQSIHKPNILNYGEKDYPEQLRFHKSDLFLEVTVGEKPTLKSLSLSGGLQILTHILNGPFHGVLDPSSLGLSL